MTAFQICALCFHCSSHYITIIVLGWCRIRIFIHRYFIHCFQSSEFVYHILYFLSFFCIVLNKRRFRPNNLNGSVLFLTIVDIFWRRIVTWMEVIIETCSRVVISLTPSRTVNTFANVGESASASGNTFCLKY